MHIKDGQVAFGKKIPDKKRLEYDIDAEGKTFRAKSINALDIVYSGNLSKNNEVVVPLTKNEYNKVEKIINNFSINPISESTIMYLGDNAILSCLNEDGSIKIGDPDTDLIFNGARTIIKSDFFGKENSDGSRDAVVFESDLPTSTSDLINDSGFITLQDVDLSGYDDTEIRLLIDEKASTKFVTSEVSALDSAI